jgi:succinate dehydrogenase/fumarate reductase flavoprotein subunit
MEMYSEKKVPLTSMEEIKVHPTILVYVKSLV